MRDDEDDSDALADAWAESLSLASGAKSAERYVTPFAAYKDDLVEFGRDVLGHRYWAGQEAVLRRVLEKHFVVLRKPRKTGGTFAAADLALAFLMTRPSIVICSSPSVRQVREVMFAKIRVAKARARTKLPGEAGVQSLRIDDDWMALGIATSDPENILGFHSGIDTEDFEDLEGVDQQDGVGQDAFANLMTGMLSKGVVNDLLFIFDEANGIDAGIYNAVSGSLSGDNVFALAQANPLLLADSEHPYARMFHDGSGWWRMHVAAHEPREDSVKSDECYHSIPENLLPQKWIDERRLEWGEDSPLYQAYVLGCFTSGAAEFQIIPLNILQAAARYDLPDDDRIESRHIGLDVAGAESGAGDFCVAVLTINGVVAATHKWKSSDTTYTIDMLQALTVQWGLPNHPILSNNVHMDATGLGKGLLDRFRQKGMNVDAVDFGGRPRYDWKHITGDMKFRDRKTELYWVMRRALQEGHAIIPPKYQDIWRQLQWQTWKSVPKATETVIAMRESKDDLRSRYGRSPDEADAMVISMSRSNRRPTFRLVSAGSIVRP